MRVAALVHYWVPKINAGSEVMIHQMLAELASRGHEVQAFVTCNPEHEPYVLDGVTVTKIDVAAAIQHIEAFQPDVIVTHHHRANYARKAADVTSAKLVHILHNDHAQAVGKLRGLRPDLTVVNTRWIRKTRSVHFHKRPSIIVHPPVDFAKHSTAPGDKVTLVNMFPAKGSDVFYALAEMMPETSFLAVEGGYAQQDLRNGGNVTVQPHTSNMKRDVWAKTRILLMPSEYESYGLAGVEALCSGIPVIAHPTPGLLESLGPAGIFADRDDLVAWKQAIEFLSDEVTYRAAHRLSLDRAHALNPTDEMRMWAERVESLVT